MKKAIRQSSPTQNFITDNENCDDAKQTHMLPLVREDLGLQDQAAKSSDPLIYITSQ